MIHHLSIFQHLGHWERQFTEHKDRYQNIKHLHIFSDGAVSKFKNRFTLSTILNPTSTINRFSPLSGVSLERAMVKALWMVLVGLLSE